MNSGESLQRHLERFLALQQHGEEAVFMARLTRLRAVQNARLRTTHADLFARRELAPALDFLLTDIYGGADLLPVAKDIQRALPYALKLLPHKVLETSACALEAAVLTQELDEALVAHLGSQLDAPLALTEYAAAFRALGKQEARQLQLRLIRDFGQHLERYLRSRLLLSTFKMVRKPAHKAGFGHLYDFMQRCFDVMQPVPDAALLLDTLVNRESAIMARVFAGAADPFLLHEATP